MEEGATVPVGALLGTIEAGEGKAADSSTKKSPAKPGASKASSAGRVSGVRNLAYIAEQGVDLAQEINIYRQLVPFNNMVLLIAEPVREIMVIFP